MATGYLYHELFSWLDPGTRAALFPSDPRRGIQPFQHYDLSDTRRRVQTAEHVARIVAYSDRPGGGDAGDGISPFGCGTYDIAALAAGGVLESVDAVWDNRARNAYALIHPAGHHALADTGMGSACSTTSRSRCGTHSAHRGRLPH
jgi:hypothetical protein